MSDISLNSGIRSNLLSLQSSSKLFQRTTDRLASGRKVNTAIDNPTNFFASVNLTDRSAGISARLDGMGQAIQQIKAADNGITTIRNFISAMKGVVNNALSNTDANARQALGRQFNELIVQISEVAKDSGYQGINLLERNETNVVQFNETFGASLLNVRGFDLFGPGAEGRGRLDASGNLEFANVTGVVVGGIRESIDSVASASEVTASGYLVTGDTAAVTVSFAGQAGFTATDATGTELIGTAFNVGRESQAAGTFTGQAAIIVRTQDDETVIGIRAAQAGSSTNNTIDWGADTYKLELAALVNEIERFDEVLKTQASNLAQNLATITIREDFSNALINTLNEGSDKLILADLNEEGANLLALQTSSQLATQSLSLASQQAQGVLQLLG